MNQQSPTSVPLAIAAWSGAASELVGIVQAPRAGSLPYVVTAIVGTGELLAELAGRLEVPLLADLDGLDPDTHLAISGGGPARAELIAEAGARGFTPATLIHADTTIGPWVDIGHGSTLSPGVRVTGNVQIGAFCQLHTGAVVSHDDVLAEQVTLSPAATLCGGVSIGPRSTVFAGATVMPGISIGADVTVGAGALVHRDVPDGKTVAGVPARVLGSD